MTRRTLAEVASRVRGGTMPVIAIKEFVDSWNRYGDFGQIVEQPEWISGDAVEWVNYWLAGAAEHGAARIGRETPAWANLERYFSRVPIVHGGPYLRRYALMETPSAWRRRLLFIGQTTMRGPSD